jgi:hypothetical protein
MVPSQAAITDDALLLGNVVAAKRAAIERDAYVREFGYWLRSSRGLGALLLHP